MTNTSAITDAYALTLKSDLANWKLELIDPATGLVIATDTNGDGIWDSGLNVSTGNLAPGGSGTYRVRATVPAGAVVGTGDTATLKAVSNHLSLAFAEGTDEITVLAPASFATVDVLPDQSGVVIAGSSVAYAHRVVNNTGAAEIFDLTTSNTLGWATIHTTRTAAASHAGTDLQVANTATIPNGGSQLVFLVVTALSARQREPLTSRSSCGLANQPTRYDSATDTTTVVPGGMDLSGGGTRMVAPSPREHRDLPGDALQPAPGRHLQFLIGPSSPSASTAGHPTELWVEVAGVMTFFARDTTGNGGFESATTVSVAAGALLNYELRQPSLDPARPAGMATATASATGEKDSVCRWLVAALIPPRSATCASTRAASWVRDRHAARHGRSTSTRSRSGGLDPKLLTKQPVVAARGSAAPILYRVETSASSARTC